MQNHQLFFSQFPIVQVSIFLSLYHNLLFTAIKSFLTNQKVADEFYLAGSQWTVSILMMEQML